MKRIHNIFILTLIWIICGARSCGDEGNMEEQREKKLLTSSKDSIRKAIEVVSPTDLNLKAYEAKACQKLSDFADYLKIASDSLLDETFRQQAAGMTRKLFAPGEINTEKWGSTYNVNDMTTLDKLLEESLERGQACWVQPEQIIVMKPLTKENDSTFKGRLSFYQKRTLYSKPDSSEIMSGKVLIDFYALKRIKPFGNEKLRVWEVYLGDID